MSIILKLLAFLLLLAILASVGFAWYYFYVFQPKKIAFIQEQKDIHAACIAGTTPKYEDFWDRECSGFGYQPKCRLPGEIIARLDQTLTDDKNACNVTFTETLKTINYIFPWDKKDSTQGLEPEASPSPSPQ